MENSYISIEELSSLVHVAADDPKFYQKVFTAVSKSRKSLQAKDGDNLRRVCAEEYDELSRRIDKTRIQNSYAVRNVLRTRRLANLLINDKGELNASLLPRVITHLSTHLHFFGPQRQQDSRRNEHILKVLKLLHENKDLARIIHHISKPHLHPLAEQIIRDTLQLPITTTITDAHTRRAVLSAWMCYLRQSLGSCFATAPAILVHQDHPEMFLIDLRDLLSIGMLKRTFSGKEYSVPLNSSWGSGELRKPLILMLEAQNDYTPPWFSPGIQNALISVGILDPDLPSKEKVEETRKLILSVFPEWNSQHPFVLTHVEEILERILMKHLEITPKDLIAYDNRPKNMVYSTLMVQSSTGMGGKGEACANYHVLIERAGNVFKALADNALLKAWEYTLASFSETKSEFTRWNLYASLGLGPNETQGIGQCMYEVIKHKLEMANQKAAELQREYEQAYFHIKGLEAHSRHASSDKDSQWTRVEFQSKLHEFHVLEELKDNAVARAGVFAQLFNSLIKMYDQLFPEYFQEVYDPDLHEVQTGPFDDSPAGFRLLYKHGRSNTSQWTKIKTPNEFIEALNSFFISTEAEIATRLQLEDFRTDFSDIVTAIIAHVKTDEFLESSFYRMAAAHRKPAISNPLDNLDKIPIKPWAYVSGGTMPTLISCYFSRDQKPSEVNRWVENPTELLVFLVDTLKQIPHLMMEQYVNSEKSLLMYSPTHAFLLKPGMNSFKETWQSEAFTYTWVRDTLIKPMEHFVEAQTLDEGMISMLTLRLLEKVPDNFKHYFAKSFSNMYGSMGTVEFRDYILDRLTHERGLQYRGRSVISSEDIDSILYELLPLFPKYQLPVRTKEILKEVLQKNTRIIQTRAEEFVEIYVDKVGNHDYADSLLLRDVVNAALCFAYGMTSLPFDVHAQITKAMQKLGFSMPSPIIFADTNWTEDFFAFLVSPGTGRLELWRIDPYGNKGSPMTVWEEWLDGSRKEPPWGVFNRPDEYRGHSERFHDARLLWG